MLWLWAAIACALTVAVALRLPANAGADAEPLLGVNVSKGHINLAVISPRDSEVTFFEDVNGERQELGKATSVPPAAGGPDGLASIPALAWRCDRTVRRFIGVAQTRDGRTIEVANEARTPDCRDRVSLHAPSRVAPGARVPITIRDRWQLGDLKMRFCVSRPGAQRKCSHLAFKPEQMALNLSRDAGRRVVILDLDLIVARTHRHLKVGVGRAVPERVGRVTTTTVRPVMLVTGDSMMEGIDTILAEKLKSKYRVIGQVRPGTGVSKSLGKPWTTVAREQAAKQKPDVTVVLLGGNDGFKMTTERGNDVECCGEPWRAEYRSRLEQMATAYQRAGRGRVIWSLLPPARRTDLAEQMSAVNDAIRQMAADMPGIQLVALDQIFGPDYHDQINGRQVRDPDGLHFALAGQRMAAQAILEALRKVAPAQAASAS